MNNKCNLCEIKDIVDIKWYDYLLNKCSKCDFIIIKREDFIDFCRNILIIENIGNNRKYYNINDMSSLELFCMSYFSDKIDSLLEYLMSIDKNSEIKCSVCHSFLSEIIYKKNYHFYYCQECDTIYFLKEEFDYFIKMEIIKPLKFVYFIIKIKEIFTKFFKKRK